MKNNIDINRYTSGIIELKANLDDKKVFLQFKNQNFETPPSGTHNFNKQEQEKLKKIVENIFIELNDFLNNTNNRINNEILQRNNKNHI